MSDESKVTKPFEFPMMPIFGLDLGERLGEFSADQKHIRNDIQKLETRIDVMEAKFEAKFDAMDAKFDAMDAKFEAKTDKTGYALNRLDERTKSLESKFNLSIGLNCAILAAVVAGFILQYLK